MRKYAALPILAIAVMLTGCASGPAFEKVATVPSDKALIYIYRPSTLHGAMFSPVVRINDDAKFPLDNGGYRPYVSMPGTIKLSIANVGTRSITIEAIAGQTYYVRGGTIPMGLGMPSIETVPAEEGATEIQECKLLPEVVALK